MKLNKVLILCASMMMLASCGISTPGGNRGNQGSGDNQTSSQEVTGLQLLSFKSVEKVGRMTRSTEQLGDKNTTLEATVKNEERDSFVDLVLYISWLNTEVVYNEGNGTYVCTSTTVKQEGMWVTKITLDIELQFSKSTYDCSVEVKEVNFLHSGTERMKAALNDPNISLLTFQYNGYDTVNFTDKPEIIESGIVYRVHEGAEPYVSAIGTSGNSRSPPAPAS